MSIIKKIKNILTRNKLVPHGVYITYDNIRFDIYDKRFLNRYKLIESNFKNRKEEEIYAEALTQVCPYCASINDLAYRPISHFMLFENMGYFSNLYVEERLSHFYNSYRVTCPTCKCKYEIIYNINSGRNKYFGEI